MWILCNLSSTAWSRSHHKHSESTTLPGHPVLIIVLSRQYTLDKLRVLEEQLSLSS